MGAKMQTDHFGYNITGNTTAMVRKVKDFLRNSYGVCPTIALLTIIVGTWLHRGYNDYQFAPAKSLQGKTYK